MWQSRFPLQRYSWILNTKKENFLYASSTNATEVISLCIVYFTNRFKEREKKNCNINHMVTVNDQLFMWNDFILKLEVYNTLCNVYYLSIYIRKHIEFTIIYTSSDQLLSIVIMSEDAYFIECFDKKL